MAAGAGSFPKTVGSSSSLRDPMLMYLYLSAGGGTWVQNAPSLLLAPAFLLPDCLKLSDRGTDPIGDGTEGIFDVTSGANGMKEELLTIFSDACRMATSGTDAAEGTGSEGEISSTIPPRLILSFGTLEKKKA
ncbi:hypothetical protein Fot_07959 [Forsythia ovata]|uniref:Uncharacterized protein n=1 Tax=Forsythia ovata TaxID=205694 RepID=A0ABD1WX96_9LAMI